MLGAEAQDRSGIVWSVGGAGGNFGWAGRGGGAGDCTLYVCDSATVVFE